MAYIAESDIQNAIGVNQLIQLTDDVGNGQVGTNAVNAAIEYAQGTFEGYARTRYALPVPTTNKVISLNLDLAIFDLTRRRATLPEGVYKVAKDRHDAAISFLKDVSSGKAGLDVPAVQETASSPASPDQVLSDRDRVFSDRKLWGM
ncbi:MAG TPA: DUF1320 domain-containing protein [Blastocatellia bacterium]